MRRTRRPRRRPRRRRPASARRPWSAPGPLPPPDPSAAAAAHGAPPASTAGQPAKPGQAGARRPLVVGRDRQRRDAARRRVLTVAGKGHGEATAARPVRVRLTAATTASPATAGHGARLPSRRVGDKVTVQGVPRGRPRHATCAGERSASAAARVAPPRPRPSRPAEQPRRRRRVSPSTVTRHADAPSRSATASASVRPGVVQPDAVVGGVAGLERRRSRTSRLVQRAAARLAVVVRAVAARDQAAARRSRAAARGRRSRWCRRCASTATRR